jgi:hypothetical protein
MNDDTTPFQPNELDELLSAELDGEIDAAGRDLGLSADQVAARLRATPGVADRRSTLAAARELLSEPPEIEELLAARLRAKAVRAVDDENATRVGGRRDRRRRMLLTAVGIAAAIAAVFGVAAGLSASRSGTHAADSKAAGATKPENAATPNGRHAAQSSALGPFSDVRALAQAAVSRTPPLHSAADAAGNRSSYKDSQLGATSTATSSTSQNSSLKSPTVPAATGLRPETAFGAAADSVGCKAPPQLLLVGQPVLRATATLSGKPVVVLVFAGDREHTVVVEDAHCTLLNVQMLS